MLLLRIIAHNNIILTYNAVQQTLSLLSRAQIIAACLTTFSSHFSAFREIKTQGNKTTKMKFNLSLYLVILGLSAAVVAAAEADGATM